MTSTDARILIVDDDRRLTELLEIFLSENGFAVESVESAGAMLQRVADSPPDLILLDIMLPDFDGFQALEQLRNGESSNRVPVIMLTALVEPSFRARGIRSGADDYIGKPFDLDELLSRVSLRLHQARQILGQRRAAVSAGLLAVGRVAASERAEDIVHRVTTLTCDLLSARASGMMLWDEDDQAFSAAGCCGLPPQEEALFNSLRIPAGSYPVIDDLIRQARPFGCSAGTAAPPAAWILNAFQLLSVFAAPVLHAQQLYGALVAGRDAGSGEFGEEDVALLGSIAGQAGLALANLRAIKQLERQAVTDGLTGLYNPRYLREFLTQQLARTRRTGERTSVIMLDLDHFKQVNDQFGHLAGDRVLGAVAITIRSSVREADSVARYGGDEFAVVLPSAGRRQAERIAQRILRRIRETEVDAEQPALRVTVSAGVATAAASDDARSLLQAADAALYAAKGGGRDCVR